MTQLIVSVRSANEALAALQGGADLIDVKEPHHGSLGAATDEVLHEVADAVVGRRPLSAALGELADGVSMPPETTLKHYSYAKIGLAGTAADDAHWRQKWAQAVAQLPVHLSPVGVIYADASTCGAPELDHVIRQASALSCGALLVDTFTKDGLTLLDHWCESDVAGFVQAAKQNRMLSVVAGALDHDAAEAVAKLNPDYIAVRSAVCTGDRTGDLCPKLVANLRAGIERGAVAVGTTNSR